MAGIKRKEVPISKSIGSVKKKKVKGVQKISKKSPPLARDLETATDSDPIVESDTTEHSGDDDGESWPSENEEIEESVPAKLNGKQMGNAPQLGKKADGPVLTNGQSSKEAHAKQRAVAHERKAAKPNADSIARSKKLWERLRRKSHVPREERKKLVEELYNIITGRVKEFVLKHDSVRVIQTALKYANKDQRKMIAKELKGEYRQLSQSKYAKFLIGKLLAYGDDEIRDLVVPEFYGSVRKLINHPEASWILDDIYRGAATPAQKSQLLREWYGAEFAIFRAGSNDSAELKTLLADHPEKRAPIMRPLHELINQLVQKKTTGFTMLHDAMLQYYLNVTPGSEEAKEFVEELKGDEEGDLFKNLGFTKSGAHLVCLVLAHITAKDRKQILKVYKGTMELLAFDANGHQVLLVAYDVIDDTVLTSKSIFPELFGKDTKADDRHDTMLAYVTNLNARIPLLYLFASNSKAFLPAEDISILQEIHHLRSTTSKKNPETRRKELVTALSPYLFHLIARKADILVSTSFGCQFISEVLLGGEGDKKEALQAVANLAQADPETRALLEAPTASRMLKALVLSGKYNAKTKSVDVIDPPLGFADMLYDQIRKNIIEWATGSGPFVVLSMLESNDFGEKPALVATLKQNRGELEKALKIGSKAKDGGEKVDKDQKVFEAGKKGMKLVLAKINS